MAYVPIDPNTIKVGDPIKKELLDLLKANFDDHEARLQILSGGSGKISIFNEDIILGVGGELTAVLFYEVIQSCVVVEGAIQLFEKAPATTGNLTVDVKKNTTTNPTGFNSIFTTPPTLNIATAADYQRAVGTINPAAQVLNVGDILRIDITSLPVGLRAFRTVLLGEF